MNSPGVAGDTRSAQETGPDPDSLFVCPAESPSISSPSLSGRSGSPLGITEEGDWGFPRPVLPFHLSVCPQWYLPHLESPVEIPCGWERDG